MPRRSVADIDEGVQLFRAALYVGPACFILLSLLWFFLLTRGAIGGWAFLALLVLNLPITAATVVFLHRSTSGAARWFVRSLLAGEDIPPPRSYPHQELLIAQARYAEAAEYFRDHLAVEPDDHDARLRLAHLLESRLSDDAGAELLYLEVRRGRPAPAQAFAASNGLIDLYRRSGRRDRLKVELARFADVYRGTAPGAAAARELRALKAEDTARGA